MAARVVSSPSSVALRFEQVTKRFRKRSASSDEFYAVRDIRLLVEHGEAIGIIGPNGAGKSTLLKLAAGVTTPTDGRITRTSRSVAVIELGAGLHPELTGRESIDFLARLATGRGVPDRATYDDIVAFSGLGPALDHRTRTYSTGMIARLAFSVAVHLPTDLLLVDEVLSVGDLEFQRRCRERIFAMRSQGTTVVLVSHDLSLVSAICDRTVLLVDGRVEADGSTDATIRRYLGQAEAPRGHVDLRLTLSAPTYDIGRPVTATFDVPEGAGTTAARFQFVIPTPPGLGQDRGPSIVCGATTVDIHEVQPHLVTLSTSALPPGRYELHVTLVDSVSDSVAVQSVPFTLTGPPGPNAIRMPSTTTIEKLLHRPSQEVVP